MRKKGSSTMKKILSCLLVVMLLCSLSVAAFADNFVSSVANAGAPEVAEAAQADGSDGKALIDVTPMDEKDKLPEAQQTEMDAAFDSLDKASDLAAVNEELKAAAADQSIAVSDLFDIRVLEEGTVSFPLTITLKDKNLDNFVALLHYVDGAWQWVDAEVADGALTFTVDSLSPFAIIVAVDEATSANTGDTVPYGFIIGAVVLAGAAAWFFAKSRKVKA